MFNKGLKKCKRCGYKMAKWVYDRGICPNCGGSTR